MQVHRRSNITLMLHLLISGDARRLDDGFWSASRKWLVCAWLHGPPTRFDILSGLAAW